ncbi:DUF5979 domain-containing protein [Arcanobacterium hippocoleae]|uniref:DUF5979 domain-containing protein n=1 Tax=Arcanobacterium hippocoleae TaxID=149017 RepID=UPI0033410918
MDEWLSANHQGWSLSNMTLNSDMCQADYADYYQKHLIRNVPGAKDVRVPKTKGDGSLVLEAGKLRQNLYQPNGQPLPIAQRPDAQACSSNTIYVPVGDQAWRANSDPKDTDMQLRLQLNFKIDREPVTFKVDQQLTGEAAFRGNNGSFPWELSCTDPANANNKVDLNGDEEAGTDKTLSFTKGTNDVHNKFTVPANLSCTLKPKLDSITGIDKPNMLNITADPVTFESTAAKAKNPLTVTHNLEFKKADLTVSHTSDVSAMDSAHQQEMRDLPKDTTIQCRFPWSQDEAGKPNTKSYTYPGPDFPDSPASVEGLTWKISDLPVGTVCSHESTTIASTTRASVTNEAQPNEVTIAENPAANANKIAVTSKFTPLVGEANVSLVLQAKGFALTDPVAQAIPKQQTAKLRCGAEPEKTVNLNFTDGVSTANGNVKLPVGTECTLTLNSGTIENKALKLGAIGFNSTGLDTGAQTNTQGNTYTFTTPTTADAGYTIQITAPYSLNTVPLQATVNTYAKQPANARGDAEKWQKAFAARNAAAQVKVTAKCYYGADPNDGALTLERTTTANPNGTFATVSFNFNKEVGVGWNCEFATNVNGQSGEPAKALKVAGANLLTSPDAAIAGGKQPGWSATGVQLTGNPQALTSAKFTVGEQAINATYNLGYQMQGATVGMKKKVAGEGVSQILATKLYAVAYKCTLNGQTVVDDIWYNLSRFNLGAVPNFMQGLPAGAECTFKELAHAKNPHDQSDQGAIIENAKWSMAWSATDGPMARDGEKQIQLVEKPVTDQDSGKATGEKEITITLPKDQPAAGNKYLSKQCQDTPQGIDPLNLQINSDASALKNCNTDSDAKAYGNYNPAVAPFVPRKLPENFFGTLSPLNTYNFEKTKLVFEKKLSGDGKALGANDSFGVRVRCYVKQDASTNIGGVDVNTNQSNWTFTVGGNSGLKPNTQFGNTADEQRLMREIPLGYTCEVAEDKFESYDATTSTALTVQRQVGENAPAAITDTDFVIAPQAPAENEAFKASFPITKSLVGSENGKQIASLIALNNKYTRERTPMVLGQMMSNHDQFNLLKEELGINDYVVSYVCEDPVLKEKVSGAGSATAAESKAVVYQGVVNLPANNTPPAGSDAINLARIQVNNPEFQAGEPESAQNPRLIDLPVGSRCSFVQHNPGYTLGATAEPANPLDKFKAGDTQLVRLDSRVEHKINGKGMPDNPAKRILLQEMANISDPSAAAVQNIELAAVDPQAAENKRGNFVLFNNSYYVPRVNYSFATYLEGLEGGAQLNGRAVDLHNVAFNYGYKCELPSGANGASLIPQRLMAAGGWTVKANQQPGEINDIVNTFATKPNPAPAQPGKTVPLEHATNYHTFDPLPVGTACEVRPVAEAGASTPLPKQAVNLLAASNFAAEPSVIANPPREALFDTGNNELLYNPEFVSITENETGVAVKTPLPRVTFGTDSVIALNASTPMQVVGYQVYDREAATLPTTGIDGFGLYVLLLLVPLLGGAVYLVFRRQEP